MLRQGSFLWRPLGSFLFRPKGAVPRARRGQSHAPFPISSSCVESNTMRLSFKNPFSSNSERSLTICLRASSFVARSFASMNKLIFRSIHLILPRSSSPWRLLLHEKSVGICICCRPTLRGFSHCPSIVGRQRQKPTPVYAIIVSDRIPHGIPCRMLDNYISTGIYRCSILDY